MDNIFANVERRVVKYSTTGKQTATPLDKASDTMISNIALRTITENQEFDDFQSQLDRTEREAAARERQEKVISRTLLESKREHKMGQLANTGKLLLFKEILFEVFYNSLVMDSSFLSENKNTLRGVTDRYIDENGGYSLLESAAARSGSVLLSRMKKSIDKLVLEVCKRKISESNQCNSCDEFDFDLNEDEQSSFDYTKKDLSLDEVEELVKRKVLTVVKDEQERKQQEEELITDIEDDLSENEGVTDEASMNEALSKIIINKSPIHESTLFDSLFRSSYKECITENVAIASADSERHDDDDYDDDWDDDDDTDFEDEEDDDENGLDMDMIFTEAITKYTLLEVCYTLKLEDYSRENLRKLTEKLLNQ